MLLVSYRSFFTCVRSMGYMGAFVPVVYTSPCPSFNLGKTAPGGGRGSRSPPAEPVFLWLYVLT